MMEQVKMESCDSESDVTKDKDTLSDTTFIIPHVKTELVSQCFIFIEILV